MLTTTRQYLSSQRHLKLLDDDHYNLRDHLCSQIMIDITVSWCFSSVVSHDLFSQDVTLLG